MKTIKLTKGQVAIVDDQDYERISHFKWCAKASGGGCFYAVHGDFLTRREIYKAIRIGELLTEEKAKLNHGSWLPWLTENVDFDRTTAFRYMRVYARRDELKCCSVQHLNDA